MNSRDKANALIAILVLLGLFLLRGPQPDSVSETNSSKAPRHRSMAEIDKKIEDDMKAGRFSEELLRERRALENEIEAPRPNGQIDPSAYSQEKEPLPLTVKGENPGERIMREQAESSAQQAYLGRTPAERIAKKINRDEYAREYEKLQEEAFVRQYIENARKQGYDIRLNAKGEIMSAEYVGTDDPQTFPAPAQRIPQSEDTSSESNKSGGDAAR